MKTAVIYARVSSEGQEENTSLSMQLEKAESYAKTYDFHVNQVFQDVSSGGNTERDGFQEMMTYLDTYPVNAIIVYKLDRLHRSLKNLLNHKDELERKGVNIISVSEQIDTTTPNGKLFFNIIGSFAEFEKDVINQRTSQGKKQKIQKGLFTAGRVPYGYRIESNSYIEIVEDEAENVRRIFTLKAKEQKSMRDIAVDVFGDVKKYGQVNYILKNSAYTGKLHQENRIIKIPAIITTNLFNKVNK